MDNLKSEEETKRFLKEYDVLQRNLKEEGTTLRKKLAELKDNNTEPEIIEKYEEFAQHESRLYVQNDVFELDKKLKPWNK